MKTFVVSLGLVAGCASGETVAVVPMDAPAGGRTDATERADAAPLPVDAAPPSDAPPSNTCMSATTCTNAVVLGTVSGDTGAGMLSASGYQAAWYRVRVTEDYSDLPGLALRVAATLTRPSGANFDVLVYVNPTSDTIECNTTTGTVTVSGNTTEVRAEWGEGFVPNGGDDSRDVSIEIRPANGTNCAANQTWQLEIDGNWL